MDRYDNYSPEIPYGDPDSKPIEDSGASSVNPQKAPAVEKRAEKKKVENRKQSVRKKKEKRKVVSEDSESFTEMIKRWASGRNLRLITGLLLGCLGVYLLIAFTSYFSSCIKDQSIINNTAIGFSGKVANKAGEGGARLAEFLINESFGLGSFVIIFWLCAMTMKLLLGKPHFKSVDFTIKCFVALITVSLIVGLSSIGLDSVVNWGGYHGRYVNEFIVEFIGWTGAGLLCLFLIGVFVVICLRDLVNWILRLKRKRDAIKKAIAEERAARKKREDELRAMQIQEEEDARKAGESIVEEAEEPVAEEEQYVTFRGTDLPGDTEEYGDASPLYALSQEQENPYSPATDYKAELGQSSEKQSEKPISAEVSSEVDPLPASSIPEDTEDAIPDEEEEEESNETAVMEVTVNEIGQAKKGKPILGRTPDNIPYKFPSFDLLRPGNPRVEIDENEQLENKETIEKTLLDFDIPIVKISATVGPTVTLYEIVPDKGVKLASIRKLVDDIALSLSATGVRIIAPIPGKGTVGIEVANKDPQTVSMRTVLQSVAYQNSRFELPMALGSTISNEVYIADLAKMPHLLVAGATGQGKSVGLNAMIASLLYCKSPEELKFVMLDPKQVEFYPYEKLKNHYMAMMPEETEAVITEMDKMEEVLSSLVVEMENRYTLLKNASVRKVTEYNEKYKAGLLSEEEGHRFLPYIVVVVDEFGDLKMVSGKKVEIPIARLAQKGRAAGMHVIIATQRPSTDVITGLIKANFPARLAFAVSSVFDSKTILGTTGAEQLIGRGDMLISNNSSTVRVQCAFIDTPEVEALCDYIKNQPFPPGPYLLPEAVVNNDSPGALSGANFGARDQLFEEIAREIVASGQASTSSLQRRYSIGYNRAGKIMDQLEAAGIVDASRDGRARTVLVDSMRLEEILAQK